MADTAGIGGSAGAAYAFLGVVWFSRIPTWCPVGKVLNCLKTRSDGTYDTWGGALPTESSSQDAETKALVECVERASKG